MAGSWTFCKYLPEGKQLFRAVFLEELSIISRFSADRLGLFEPSSFPLNQERIEQPLIINNKAILTRFQSSVSLLSDSSS